MSVEDVFLYIKDLDLRFYTYEGIVEALDKVKLYIKDGETIGVVGETGCGKSVTGLSELVIVPPPGRIEGGRIFLKKDGRWLDLLKQHESYLEFIRGSDISMIFQDPKSALNPVYTVKDQIAEAILHHRVEELCQRLLDEDDAARKNGKRVLTDFERKMLRKMIEDPDSPTVKFFSKIPGLRSFRRKLEKEVYKEVIRMLKDMQIPDPERVANMYPHELSGGMAQRVVIAIALSCSPRLLIADEPTTNLDVTVQAQILDLIRELKKKYKTTIQYITHDMGVVAEMCDRVAVMYAGNIVELAEVHEIFKYPLHPYTKALLECIPRPGHEFKSIEGTVPSLINPPRGCRFHDRCPYAMDICRRDRPSFVAVKEDHYVMCHLYRGGSK
ncbi:MAG: ABC transporter ATP-binding protein [Candidatus Bathyarchaeia archaeon]